MNLMDVLPKLLPRAIAWVENQYAFIAKNGQPLSESEKELARRIGVLRPDLIRVYGVPLLPLPEDPELRQVAIATNMLGPDMVGLTLGHGIYICHGHRNTRLLSHEFRHVYQYEQAGSIAAFLPLYLTQIATVGYHNAPFEMDARAHEIHMAPS